MNQIYYILLGVASGVLGGMFGIGGGTILIPALVYLFHFSQHEAQGTTLAAMIPPIGLLAAWRYSSKLITSTYPLHSLSA